MTPTDADKRKAYVLCVTQNGSLESFTEDRRKKWEAFCSDDQKKIRESIVFVMFATDSGLVSSPMDHVNEDPPLPDIRSEINGEPYYFELGEITDQGLARAVSISERAGEITGGPFSQDKPLMKMFRDKCAKAYSTNGAQADLLLHYSKQYSSEKHLLTQLRIHQAEIALLVAKSPFSHIWVYRLSPPGKVLWHTTK
jgi:hypothetical protein